MNHKILFVEDDQDDVFLIERACKTAGLDERRGFLHDGKAAVDYLAEAMGGSLPALIFLDLNMPLMGGLEFLRWMRAEVSFENIPVLVLTTSENPQDIKSAYQAGANAYLVKPTAIAEFAKMIGCATQFWLDFNRMART